ncbi:MAG: hypothetical protein JXR37_34850 [Kiritimatiellae bacterium]|nr:hypothetical protein [Kiritimatiellia bacterium]
MKYPGHVWLVDLTVLPTSAGFWVPWLPFARSQGWPFCWWLATAIDHYSRKVQGFALFPKNPTSAEIRSFLARAIKNTGQCQKHMITDKGRQFWCQA